MDSDSEVEVFVSAPFSTYDIKIFFTDDDSEIPGEIKVDGEWKNSRYYVQDIEFSEKQFEIRLKNNSIYSEKLSICTRLRDFSSTSTPTKKCTSIKLSSDLNIEKKPSSKPASTSQQINQKEQFTDSIYQTYSKNISNPSNSTSNFIDLDTSPILLKSSSEKSFNTSLGKSRIALNIIVSLVAFLILYMILRSESKYREI